MSASNLLPVLALRNLTLFPGTILSVEVGRPSSLRLLEELVKQTPPRLLVAVQKAAEVDEPGPDDLYEVLVEAELLKVVRFTKDRYSAVLRGICRRRAQIVKTEPYLQAHALPFVEAGAGAEGQAVLSETVDAAKKLAEMLRNQDLVRSTEGVTEPGALADLLAGQLELPATERLALLQDADPLSRLRSILGAIRRNIEVITLKQQIDSKVQNDMAQRQRDEVLRQQMKAIQKELGEGGSDEELDQFEERIEKAGMPDEVNKVARKQLQRLRGMQSGAPEYSVQRTYLEWLCDLPWSKRTIDHIDLTAAKTQLDADHYGLEKIKKRMLEYLAVRKLAPGKKGPILCLAGPPGVGKTSLGRSIAKALGREFTRISLGGVRDEAEIRGHRRTYIGALPGRFLQALKRAGTRNPVILLDEIDKLSADNRGDPSAALLEVLDPEQNNTFSDHYLEVPFDLSEVIFITTANSLDTIPGPLLDRMELIELPGYTQVEKLEIAKRHLVPKQKIEHGLKGDQGNLSDAAIREVIEHYTREAGVRNLERELAGILRGVAVKVAAGEELPAEIGAEEVAAYLGPPRYFSDLAEQMEHPGVATGMAWTPVGGDILFIEARVMPGKGQLVLTGQLGAVMKESAQAAFSWVRSHGAQLDIPADLFDRMDLHVHVPKGGTPKDGPSAGVTLIAALVSLFTGKRVRSDVAMTGELTLRGTVLPVGGIKEKVLAAHRAGIKRVVLPERNRKDLVDIPEQVRKEMEFIFAQRIETVLNAVLEGWSGLGETAGPAADSAEALPLPLPMATPGATPGQAPVVPSC